MLNRLQIQGFNIPPLFRIWDWCMTCKYKIMLYYWSALVEGKFKKQNKHVHRRGNTSWITWNQLTATGQVLRDFWYLTALWLISHVDVDQLSDRSSITPLTLREWEREWCKKCFALFSTFILYISFFCKFLLANNDWL